MKSILQTLNYVRESGEESPDRPACADSVASPEDITRLQVHAE